MKKKIFIGSSSFLIPENNAWNKLKNFNLKFSSYGNFNEIFSNKNYDKILCFILIINDFVENSENKLNFNHINKKTNSLIKLIKMRIKNSKEPFIMCYCEENNYSEIELSKNTNISNSASRNFINKIEKLKKVYPNFYSINLNCIFSKYGTENIYDRRNWYFARSRFSQKGLEVISNSLSNIINRIYNPASKVLVLDCDNTLWGGVIGEEGINKILLGQDGIGKAFVDFQTSIKNVSEKGILLSICSKNNQKDVWTVFSNHKNMVLKKKDIICSKINWKNKADNIIEISKELNLGLNSFVFWDDNPMERSIVKKTLPEVEVVDVPDDVSMWSNMLLNYHSLQKFNITKDDLKKRKQYEQMANFNTAKQNAYNEVKYLKSIKLKPKLYKISNLNISRAEQLCMKTNQFNLRNTRYTQADIEKIVKNKKNYIYIVGLKDIFGDHGLVGLFILKKIDSNIFFIDNIVMSCRVFGRYLESWMLKCMINIVRQNHGKYLFAEYVKTDKNSIALDFLKINNFKIIKEKKKNMYKNSIIKSKSLHKKFLFEIKNDRVANLEVYKRIT